MVKATTPAPLSLSDAVPPTYPVVYSPVPTMRTLTLDDMVFAFLVVERVCGKLSYLLSTDISKKR
jgi:hypothetical protein